MQAITSKPRVFVKHRKPTKMPRLTRETLAHKFRQNWMAKHPGDGPASGLDDSLTSLNWLQNLNIMKITTPTPPASPTPLVENTRQLRVNPNSVLNMTNLPQVKQEPGLIQPTPIFPGMPETVNPPTTTSPVDMIDYKTNPYVKPPYSYATLICMAMKESKKNKITLSGIYNWITDNFMYYRVADPSWQNSIRHNLSLNKSFQKVPRRKDEPGKGGFWRINPDYVDMLENGILRRRRSSARENIAPTLPVKRLKTDQDDTRPMKSQCTNANQSHNRVNTPAVKVEPIHEDSRLLHMGDVSSGLDFSWSSILTQDIDVGGIKIKTEDIINETEQAANTITALSPPPSDSNSDVSLDDLLSADLGGADMDAPLDLTTGHDLDLTVQGQSIKAPDWWSESLNGALDISIRSGLHTPIAPSPVPEEIQESHPWAENKSCVDQAMCAFDIDIQSLFDFDGHSNGSH